MWQRVQTLYLALATIAIGSMFFCNFSTIIGPAGEEITVGYAEKLEYLLFLIMLTVAQFLALGSFKHRLLQMRVCVLISILLLAFQIWIGVDIIRNFKEMTFSVTAVFPLAAIILDILAARAIMLDEALVQTASRLRGSRKRK